ncbi:hypothetical protein MATL_G00004830 [Megalops atlanticus]|uniref:PHD-type domain-containing protein n=1 Tax=Megalops atlanticus TaxID=7932 RepID=A0A9D3QIM5_MEGAT|nr:hypothetical protein MATL_G00004830 [Megalops atlanticus]
MHTQSQQPQFQQNFSPISNPSPAASLVQSPSCSSSPSPLMGISEGPGNSTAPPAHQPSYPLPNPRNGHNHNRLLQTMPQLSPTPNSNSSSSSCGSSSGHGNTAGLSASPGSTHSRKGVGLKGMGIEQYISSSHYTSSPHEKQILDPGTNSLNALTSQVANLPNTVQQMLLSDSLLLNNRGKDSGQQIQQSLHSSLTSQQRNRGNASTTRREDGRTMDSSGTNSEGGTDEESSHVMERPKRGRDESEEHILKGEDEVMRQLSGTNRGSETTGGCPASQIQVAQAFIPAKSQNEQDGQGSPSCVEVEASKKHSKTSSSPSVSQIKVDDNKTHGSVSPSSTSSLIKSDGINKVQPPLCPSPTSFSIPKSPSASQTLISSSHSNCCEESGVTFSTRHLRREKEMKERIDTMKTEAEDSEDAVVKFKSDTERGDNHDREVVSSQEEMEGERDSQISNKQNDETEEKKEMARSSDDKNKNLTSEETHSTGVGVIVSARSEVTQPESVTEQPQTPQTTLLQSFNMGNHSYHPKEDTHSYSSFRNATGQNGEGERTLSANASVHGPKVHSKPAFRYSPHQSQPRSQRSPYGFSESLHSSGRNLKNSGVGSSEDRSSNFDYQGYQQLQQLNAGLQKRIGAVGVEGQGRRSISGLETERGLDSHAHQQQYPSLLQEVLQGYHTDKRYRHTENRAQQLPPHNTSHQFQNMPYQHPHSRHPSSMTESMKPHAYTPQTGTGVDHCSPSETAVPGKLYPLGQRHEGEVGMGQDALHTWCSGRVEPKGMHWSSLDKNKMLTSPSRSTTNMQESSELSQHPLSKHINLVDYSVPTGKHSSNQPTPTSAVQQLLLKEVESTAGNEASMGQTRPQTPSPLPSLSSLERRSVICDFSPSRLHTPERDRNRDKGDTLPQPGSSGASVIQQSLSASSVLKQESCKEEEKVNRKILKDEALHRTKEVENAPFSHPSTKEISIQHQNRTTQPTSHPLDMNSDPHNMPSVGKGIINSANVTPRNSQQSSQQHTSSPMPLSSPSPSRFQSYFQGLDESRSYSAGFSMGNTGEGIVKMSLQHSQQLSHYQHLSSHPQNPQHTNKLQGYPNLLSLQPSDSHDDRFDWTAQKNNTQSSSQDMVMSCDSNQNQTSTGIRSNASVQANQQHLPPHQDRYYNVVKLWDSSLSGRKNDKIIETDASQRNQHTAPVVPTGSVSLPPGLPDRSKHLQSNPSGVVTEENVRAFHPTSTPISVKHTDSSSSSSGSGSNVNAVAQGKAKIGGSGDTNPLITRRRVRSFISPIPAKRQHQDMDHRQQQQKGASSIYTSLLTNSDVRQHVDGDTFRLDTPHFKLVSSNTNTTPIQNASPVSPSSCMGKTKVLPPRKGRGLKLEAIVQKITPNVKKTRNNDGDTDPSSNHLSSMSHTEMTYIPDMEDQNSCIRKFSKIGAGRGSCLPYESEGMSLEEIMSYRGVDETGPLPPSVYPYDPHQDTQILKCDMTGKGSNAAVGELEPALDFGIKLSGSLKTEPDYTGESGNDDLRIPPDFTLLGPLPPPPPLPCPVQASPPPSSSALSDIQRFTTTYQQLETRRGEHSAATLLRQKLQESGGVDDYSGREYLGTKSPYHNQNPSHCLLPIPSHSHLPHHQQHTSTGTTSMMSLSQFTEPKPLENVVPKGYFPSGKKKGRPVGSVNKQKRAQAQSQSLPVNSSPVTQIPTPASAATPQTEMQSTTTTTAIIANYPEDNKTVAFVAPATVSQTEKADEDSEETQPEVEVKPCRQRGRKKEGVSEGDGVECRQRQRTRGVGVFGKAKLRARTGSGGNVSNSGVLPSHRKSVFVPYIHVECKMEETGNVCTVVNAVDERKKGEGGEERGGRWTGKEEGGGSITPLNSTLTSQLARKDEEREKVKEKRHSEKVDASLIQSSPTGKALPSSGYVISGSVMTEISTFGHLLCCLCKKWANYKDLGDLYGPYYPPEYATRLPKNNPVIRQSLGTTSVGMRRLCSEAAVAESTEQEMLPVEVQTCTFATDANSSEYQVTELSAATTIDTTSLMGGVDTPIHSGSYRDKDKEREDWELTQELTATSGVLNQEEQLDELSQQLQTQQQTDDAQKRSQHRKLTSHPRFKRRHRSSEDSPKMGPINNKALLPFQPPPPLPLPNQDPSDPSAPLSLLPQVPLDPEELWVHEGCIVWASGVFLVNGRLYGLQEALDGARDTCCSHCKMMGSTLGCYSKGCTLRYHYLCAMEAGCNLNEDNFSLRCPKHKFSLNNIPVKSVYQELSERG